MQNWEQALEKFIGKWKDKKDVVGALVCGSYITGNPSPHSDIDIHILLSKSTNYRERGNEYIDGILIEYFANPLPQHIKYLESDFKNRRRVNVHMLTTGKVLFDKTGELKELINIANKFKKKKFKASSKIQNEIAKYFIWDSLDNLEEVYESNAKDFEMVYFVSLQDLFNYYATYLQYESIPIHKLRRFLSNKKDQEKYNVPTFPDSKFQKDFIKAIELKDKTQMMRAYKKIVIHVLNEIGGFNIDGWKIKTPVE